LLDIKSGVAGPLDFKQITLVLWSNPKISHRTSLPNPQTLTMVRAAGLKATTPS